MLFLLLACVQQSVPVVKVLIAGVSACCETCASRVVDLGAVLDLLAEVGRLCLWSMLVVAIFHWLAGPVRVWIGCRLVVVGPALHRL